MARRLRELLFLIFTVYLQLAKSQDFFFNGQAFASRVFSIELAPVFGFPESGILVQDGQGILSVPPRLGTVRQADCSTEVNINEGVIFDNVLFAFCFDAGPGLLTGSLDDFIVTIIDDSGVEQGVFHIFIRGDNPIDELSRDDLVIRLDEDTEIEFPVATSFASVSSEARNFDFQIEIFDIPPVEHGTLFDSNGNPIVAEQRLNSDEVITFVAFPDFATDFFGESFTFRIVFGEGEFFARSLPIEFRYFVEPIFGSLVENNLNPVPAFLGDVQNGIVPVRFPPGNLQVVADFVDELFFATLRIDSTNRQAGIELLDDSIPSRDLLSGCLGLFCTLELIGRQSDLNQLINNGGLIFKIPVDRIEVATVNLLLNGNDAELDVTFQAVNGTSGFFDVEEEEPIDNGEYYEDDPNAGDNDQDTGDNDQDTGDNDPNTGDNDPNTGDNDPNTGDNDPDIDDNVPDNGEEDQVEDADEGISAALIGGMSVLGVIVVILALAVVLLLSRKSNAATATAPVSAPVDLEESKA